MKLMRLLTVACMTTYSGGQGPVGGGDWFGGIMNQMKSVSDSMNSVGRMITQAYSTETDLPISIKLPRAIDTDKILEDQKALQKIVNAEFKRNQELQRAIFLLETQRANDPMFGAKAAHKTVDIGKTPVEKAKPEKPPIVVLDSGDLTNVDVREYMEYLKCHRDIQKNMKVKAGAEDSRQKLRALNAIRLKYVDRIRELKSIMSSFKNLSERIERTAADDLFKQLHELRYRILLFKQDITEIALGRNKGKTKSVQQEFRHGETDYEDRGVDYLEEKSLSEMLDYEDDRDFEEEP